ncbi:MAG TPA: hypothetical protein VHU23_04290 [Rhizomicrobium sp.]|nr:hypothetical protein [Rhizomicrobium sp.]
MAAAAGRSWRKRRLNERLDKLVATCGTVRFALPLLIGNRDIVLGLPRAWFAANRSGQQSVPGHCFVSSSTSRNFMMQNVC